MVSISSRSPPYPPRSQVQYIPPKVIFRLEKDASTLARLAVARETDLSNLNLECLAFAEQHLPWGAFLGGNRDRLQTCFMVENTSGGVPDYGYGKRTVPAVPMPPWVKEVGLAVTNRVNLAPPPGRVLSCNANLYVDGSTALKLHADDESLFYDTPGDKLDIVSFSVGTPRKFIISNANGDILKEIELPPFAALTMEGHFQHLLLHGIARQRHVRESRVNLTFRWLSTRFGTTNTQGERACDEP
jgi:alkylated DNA repair dioxygenase AlkB